MCLILSLETTTNVCAAALYEGEILLAESCLAIEKAHSKSLASIVDSIFKYAEHSKQSLSAVAVSSGPGSYTGLRIGTSFAKGICYSLDIPLLSVKTLDGMIQSVKRENECLIYCPMIDARRMEVYCKLVKSDGKTIEETDARIIDSNSFQDHLTDNLVYFFGDGAKKCKPFLNHKNALFHDNFIISARGIGQLANNKFAMKDFEDVAYYEPFYLKEYIAGKSKL